MTSTALRNVVASILVLLLGLSAMALIWISRVVDKSAGIQENTGAGLIAGILWYLAVWSLAGIGVVIFTARFWVRYTVTARLVRSALIAIFFVTPVITAMIFVVDHWRFSRESKIRICAQYPEECQR